jgi:hypothetical protein
MYIIVTSNLKHIKIYVPIYLFEIRSSGTLLGKRQLTFRFHEVWPVKLVLLLTQSSDPEGV